MESRGGSYKTNIYLEGPGVFVDNWWVVWFRWWSSGHYLWQSSGWLAGAGGADHACRYAVVRHGSFVDRFLLPALTMCVKCDYIR
jgi:hypothetical protein